MTEDQKFKMGNTALVCLAVVGCVIAVSTASCETIQYHEAMKNGYVEQPNTASGTHWVKPDQK